MGRKVTAVKKGAVLPWTANTVAEERYSFAMGGHSYFSRFFSFLSLSSQKGENKFNFIIISPSLIQLTSFTQFSPIIFHSDLKPLPGLLCVPK
jgi:hypothetical protein